MNFENYLSFKKALRIAVPCLALSFLVTSCSNEESTGASDKMTSSASNLTLTATVPVAKEHSSTRVGIKDDDSASPNYVWLEGETLTLYWKNLHDDDADQVLVYQVEDVSADGKSCLMNPVDPSAKLDNGFYKIHSLSPHTDFNFVDGELKATIDLGNQNQPSGAVDHSYLSDKLYQYATTVVQVYEGVIISGTTSLPYEFITSLMRVRVVNNTGLPIDVSKVSLSYSTEDNAQFYSKGIFTANPLKGAHDYIATNDAALNDLSITTSKALAINESFDVYMSFFPTAGYTANDTETLNMVVDFVVSETDAVMTRNVSVVNNVFNTGQSFLKFGGGDFFNLVLSIAESDLLDSGITLPTTPEPPFVEFDGYYYTYNKLHPAIQNFIVYDDMVYVRYSDLMKACPDQYELVTYEIISNLSSPWSTFWSAMRPNFLGSYRTDTETVRGTDILYIYNTDSRHIYTSSNGSWTSLNFSTSYMYKPICRKAK